MRRLIAFAVVFVAVLTIGAGFAGPGFAGEPPTMVKAKGGECVRDPAFMRANHMEFLKHQRDDTMHQGIRPKGEALKDCIACHVQDDAQGKPIAINAPKQFCAACHDYAAVRVDCFECHATVPDAKRTSALFPLRLSKVTGQ